MCVPLCCFLRGDTDRSPERRRWLPPRALSCISSFERTQTYHPPRERPRTVIAQELRSVFVVRHSQTGHIDTEPSQLVGVTLCVCSVGPRATGTTRNRERHYRATSKQTRAWCDVCPSPHILPPQTQTTNSHTTQGARSHTCCAAVPCCAVGHHHEGASHETDPLLFRARASPHCGCSLCCWSMHHHFPHSTRCSHERGCVSSQIAHSSPHPQGVLCCCCLFPLCLSRAEGHNASPRIHAPGKAPRNQACTRIRCRWPPLLPPHGGCSPPAWGVLLHFVQFFCHSDPVDTRRPRGGGPCSSVIAQQRESEENTHFLLCRSCDQAK